MLYLCYFYLFSYSGVQHELFTYLEHLNSPLYKVNSCVTQFSVVCVVFCGTLFVFAPFISPSILRQTLTVDSCLMDTANSIWFSYMNWPCLQTTYHVKYHHWDEWTCAQVPRLGLGCLLIKWPLLTGKKVSLLILQDVRVVNGERQSQKREIHFVWCG